MKRKYILPCEIGDTVWRVRDGRPERGAVRSFTIEGDEHLLRVVVDFPHGFCLAYRADLIGKEIFLSLVEAERSNVKRRQRYGTDN